MMPSIIKNKSAPRSRAQKELLSGLWLAQSMPKIKPSEGDKKKRPQSYSCAMWLGRKSAVQLQLQVRRGLPKLIGVAVRRQEIESSGT
ncbi:hypothetical protein SD53_17045 [Rheinheimera mesophila]|nr:hypothetical protein SD53_17045 [Rheinheimera mesophila]